MRLIAWRGEDTGFRWRGLDFVEADRKFQEALSRYLPLFERLDAGLCIYFEVVHTDINATFKDVPGLADIRIFDSSTSEAFLPFEATIDLERRLGLPLVGWRKLDRLCADDMWERLRLAAGQCYETVAAPLEGFVVREAGEGSRIAKARVEHLPKGGRWKGLGV